MFFNPALNTPASISVSTYKHRFKVNSKNIRKTVINKKLQRKCLTIYENYIGNKLFSKYVIKQFCSKEIPVCSITLSSKITMVLQGAFPPTSYLDSFLNGLFNLRSTGFQNPKKESFASIVADKSNRKSVTLLVF